MAVRQEVVTAYLAALEEVKDLVNEAETPQRRKALAQFSAGMVARLRLLLTDEELEEVRRIVEESEDEDVT